jgi:hypothetical protein
MPRDCPVCGLVNPDTAPACDCGFSFAYASTVGRVQLGSAARRNMAVGGLICFAGLTLTLLTLAASTVTGVYVLAWGAIICGAAQFVRGFIQLGKERQIATREANAEQDAAADRPRE